MERGSPSERIMRMQHGMALLGLQHHCLHLPELHVEAEGALSIPADHLLRKTMRKMHHAAASKGWLKSPLRSLGQE